MYYIMHYMYIKRRRYLLLFITSAGGKFMGTGRLEICRKYIYIRYPAAGQRSKALVATPCVQLGSGGAWVNASSIDDF